MEGIRLSRESKGGSQSLQKRMALTRRRAEPVPDLTDFMNDMFFGTTNMDEKTYDLTGDTSTGGGEGAGLSLMDHKDEEYGFDDSTRSNSARLTQEWLEEARRVMASSPTRCVSPGRLVVSPRFAASQQGRSPVPSLDRRDPFSRSARRNRGVEGFSGEILSKSSKLSRNKSDTFTVPSPSDGDGDGSPAAALHKWFPNILEPTNVNDPNTPTSPLPPLHSLNRKSRFQTTSRRTFNAPPSPDAQLISPPNNAPETAPRRSLSSLPLSPPRNLVESVHRRTMSSSTCSMEKMAPRIDAKREGTTRDHSLNGYLKEQRNLFQKISNGEFDAKAEIVLSGPSNSTTSMVAAICHAWLLGYRQRENDDGTKCVVVPVMNVKRGTMRKLGQAAWLFHHAGLDATALLFADEVDLESLTGQLSILMVGQDILRTTGEVGSQCTVLTDNYCEDAYDLLQNTVLKKLLLAGILIDTENLNASASITMTRDAEAVQLLLVGLAPNYRYALFDQLVQDQKGNSFIEALNHNYGKSPDEREQNGELNLLHKVSERKSTSTSDHEAIMSSSKTNSSKAIMSSSKTNSSKAISMDTKGAKTNKVSPKSAKLISPPVSLPSPASAQAEKQASRGKNTFFLARWFGFGSK